MSLIFPVDAKLKEGSSVQLVLIDERDDGCKSCLITGAITEEDKQASLEGAILRVT
jgi:hypothetical protein